MNDTLEPDQNAIAEAAKAVTVAEQLVKTTAATYAELGAAFNELDVMRKREGCDPWPAWTDAQEKAREAWTKHDEAIRAFVIARNRLYGLQGKHGLQVAVETEMPKYLAVETPFEPTEHMRFIRHLVQTGRLNETEVEVTEEVTEEVTASPVAVTAEPERELTTDEKRKEFARWLVEHGRVSEAE